jgi:hypothetical protein
MSSDIMTPCTGIVGNDPIVVTNVYVPVGGGTGPGGENGAIIDAFNMETGEFCDDTFVTVSPDANGNLTSQGNVLGWVNSEANVENITAYNHILPSDKYFQKWDIVEGTGDSSDTASLAVLTVGKNTNPYAFAFYSKPAKSSRFWENKPDIIDRPVKDLGAEIIKWKDAAGEGDPWRNYVVDPAEKLKMQTLIDKVSALEQQVKQLGQSFIKIQERPAVGKEIAEKGATRG